MKKPKVTSQDAATATETVLREKQIRAVVKGCHLRGQQVVEEYEARLATEDDILA